MRQGNDATDMSNVSEKSGFLLTIWNLLVWQTKQNRIIQNWTYLSSGFIHCLVTSAAVIVTCRTEELSCRWSVVSSITLSVSRLNTWSECGRTLNRRCFYLNNRDICLENYFAMWGIKHWRSVEYVSHITVLTLTWWIFISSGLSVWSCLSDLCSVLKLGKNIFH